jgi:hypothetical protein
MIVEFKKKDVAYKETVTTKEASEILGLKYHTARNKLMQNKIDHIDYDGKIVWIKEAVLDYKRSKYITSEV